MKRNKLPGIILLACCTLLAGMQANAKDIEVQNGNIILDFRTKIASQTSAGKYTNDLPENSANTRRLVARLQQHLLIKKSKGIPMIIIIR